MDSGGVAVAVDVVVLTLAAEAHDTVPPLTPLVLTVRRDHPPFAGRRSLPGGHVDLAEDLEAAARRVLAETRACVATPRHLEQLASFGAPGRDPRGRVVSVSYLALLPEAPAGADPAAWVPAADPPALAFDHAEIVRVALRRLRSKLSYSTVAYGLLGDEFTLSELQAVYEAVLDRPLDKRNFRRKVLALGLLEETGEQRRGSHRPALLYRFAHRGLVLLDDVITA